MTVRHAVRTLMLLLFVLCVSACGSDDQQTTAQPQADAALAALMPHLQPGDIQPGDILVSVNGQPVRSRQEAARAVESAKPGEPIELGIDRKGSMITLQVE